MPSQQDPEYVRILLLKQTKIGIGKVRYGQNMYDRKNRRTAAVD